MRVGRKEAILEAALRVLARDGEVDTETIAAEAEVSKALLFHHFPRLERLRDAMAERVLRETQAGLDALASEYPNPRRRLEALVEALLAEPPEAPREARHVMRFWLDGERGSARDALVADFVAKTLKEGHARVDPKAAASLLLTRWHGATAVYANGGFVDFEAERERTKRDLDAGLGLLKALR